MLSNARYGTMLGGWTSSGVVDTEMLVRDNPSGSILFGHCTFVFACEIFWHCSSKCTRQKGVPARYDLWQLGDELLEPAEMPTIG